eukprot:gnl/Chilomastix_cuspidata/512.p1 GENE.gnl/Chilomastix_cuspidata/512~~gnl/Chilomastix_cuspidata/512.p1  ORF type:complete len:1110 (-),score=277.81 gnl/Chilomastix_cuspidata/512:2854-6183(-)
MRHQRSRQSGNRDGFTFKPKNRMVLPGGILFLFGCALGALLRKNDATTFDITAGDMCLVVLKSADGIHDLRDDFNISFQQINSLVYSFPCIDVSNSLVDSDTSDSLNEEETQQVFLKEARAQTLRALSTHRRVYDFMRDDTVPRSVLDILTPTDDYWPKLWHLSTSECDYYSSQVAAGVDVNVIPVWDGGYAASGITIVLVDDGLDISHPDFAGRIDMTLSLDLLSNDGPPYDPSPTTLSDSHGTSAAGVAGAALSNNECAVGAAYEATLAGRNLLSSSVSATYMNYVASLSCDAGCHVVSCSWGEANCDSESTGCAVSQTASVVEATFRNGALNSRGGSGLIYVFSAGNSNEFSGNANARSYCRSPFTICVGAINPAGSAAVYSNPGTPLDISAPSSGYGTTGSYLGIVAPGTEVYTNECTASFGGTSSAAPLISGIIALALDAQENLGFRDIRALFAAYALKQDMEPYSAVRGSQAEFWVTNAALYEHSVYYGFGKPDAAILINAATDWTPVPDLLDVTRTVYTVADSDGVVCSSSTLTSARTAIYLEFEVTDGGSNAYSTPQRVEMIRFDAELSIGQTISNAGKIVISVESPAGTVSELLPERTDKISSDLTSIGPGIDLTSLQFYGESAPGTWRVGIAYAEGSTPPSDMLITVSSGELTIFGTRQYARFTSPLGSGESVYQHGCPLVTVEWSWSGPAADDDTEVQLLLIAVEADSYNTAAPLSKISRRVGIENMASEAYAYDAADLPLTASAGSFRFRTPVESVVATYTDFQLLLLPASVDASSLDLAAIDPFAVYSAGFAFAASGECEVVYSSTSILQEFSTSDVAELAQSDACLFVDARASQVAFRTLLDAPNAAYANITVKVPEDSGVSESLDDITCSVSAADDADILAVAAEFSCSNPVGIVCDFPSELDGVKNVSVSYFVGPVDAVSRVVVWGSAGTEFSANLFAYSLDALGVYGAPEYSQFSNVAAEAVSVLLSTSNAAQVTFTNGRARTLTVGAANGDVAAAAHEFSVEKMSLESASIDVGVGTIKLIVLPYPYPYGFVGAYSVASGTSSTDSEGEYIGDAAPSAKELTVSNPYLREDGAEAGTLVVDAAGTQLKVVS